MRVGCLFCVGLCGGLGERVGKPEDYSKWNGKRSKRVGGKSGKTGRLLQVEREEKQACWGKEWKNRKITPSGTRREASVLGKRVEKPEDYSKWNGKRSGRVGERVGKPEDCSNRKL